MFLLVTNIICGDSCTRVCKSYRIDGGAPAGINITPGDWGCRTKRISINIMTIQGKSRTRPRGIEMEELPFRRMRRRKKANRGDNLSALRERSSREGRLGEDGILLTRFCTSPISAGC